MNREVIICIIVIIAIIILNMITANFTKNSVYIIEDRLQIIRESIENGTDIDETIDNIEKLKSDWKNRYNILAYYIEHDELEKVNLYIIGIESYFKSNENKETIAELDKCEFILKHIEEKYRFSLKNIF